VVENQSQLFVGIDVSKAKLDVTLRPGAKSFSVANNQRGVATLVEGLKKLSMGRSCSKPVVATKSPPLVTWPRRVWR
jgi:hypothetical protein